MHLYIGMFLIAFTTLAVEICLVRLLSVITWYHLAFFAISTAMLGMTAGAVTVYLKHEAFTGNRLESAVGKACLAFAIVLPMSLMLLTLLPLGFERSGVTLVSIGIFVVATVLCSLPFYFSGIAITAVLTQSNLPIGRIYATDLIGAAGGCLFVLGGLGFFDAHSFLIFCGGLGGLAARAFAHKVGARIGHAGTVAICTSDNRRPRKCQPSRRNQAAHCQGADN